MQKYLKKVDFLKKFCQENLYRVTQPLNFFVQKSCLNMHMITQEFETIWFIVFKSRICDYLTPKIGNMSQCDANISKIIYTCIKICHHHGIIIVEMFSHCVGNYHVWNDNLRYQIHTCSCYFRNHFIENLPSLYGQWKLFKEI